MSRDRSPDAGRRVRSANLISVTAATEATKDNGGQGVGGPGDGSVDGFI